MYYTPVITVHPRKTPMEWTGVQTEEEDTSKDSIVILRPEETTKQEVVTHQRETDNHIINEIVSALTSLIQQGNVRGSRGRFVYMNILREVEKNSSQIERLEDIKGLKHVGENTYKKIESKIEKSKKIEEKKKYKKTDKTRYVEIEEGRVTGETQVINTMKSKKKEYIPGFRTAPYAVLRAMHELKRAHKHLIALKAAPFTDAEFSASQRFSAFGAFKLLEKHGYISSEGRGRYVVTESGELLARKLFRVEESVVEHEDQTVQLVIDSREKRNNKERMFFQEYFGKHKVESCTRFLGLGDFLWIKNEKILGQIVERKAGSDLIASISDGRFREQKRRLRLFEMQAFLLVEKPVFEETSRESVEQALMEARIQGLTVLETESIGESGWVIREIDKKVRMECSEEVMSYGSFIEEGGKQRNCTAGQLLLNALLGVRGLKKQWAMEIQTRFGTLKALSELLAQEEAEDELSKMQLDGSQLGKKMAKRIISLLG